MPKPGRSPAHRLSDVVVLLARQRSGTHAVRSVLDAHPDIFGIEEPFHLKSAQDPGTGETNFFVFLTRQARVDPLKLLPVDYESLFLEYLDYLRGFSSKRFLLLDVKYNNVHHISRSFEPLVGIPYFFELILKHGLRTFVLTRRNYLRAWVSILKTRETASFHVTGGEKLPADRSVTVNVDEMRENFEWWDAEDKLVEHTFTGYARQRKASYPGQFFTWDYAELFTETGAASSRFREAFAGWLGLSSGLAEAAGFQKLSRLPLEQTIKNFREVARALKDTKFERCLEDEISYGAAPATKVPRLWPWGRRRPEAGRSSGKARLSER